MAKFKIDTEKQMVFRKDIIGYRFLSVPARLILSSLLIYSHYGADSITRDKLCTVYALKKNTVENAFYELEQEKFITYEPIYLNKMEAFSFKILEKAEKVFPQN